jgi:uncharacterized protein YjbI with pentapeptide repeats
MRGPGLHRRVAINFNNRRTKRRLLSLLLTLNLLPVTALPAAEPEVSTAPKLLTRAELKSAVEKGEKIAGREINGEDIIAVLIPWITPDSKCVPKVGLHIEKSVIRGDVKLKFQAPPSKATVNQTENSEDDGIDESKSDNTKNETAHWLTVPLLIKQSAVNDRLEIDSLGFACAVDLSGSTFESGTDIRSTTFGADVSAVAAVFKTGMEVLGTEFKSNAGFWRVKFMGNVEFIRNMGRKSIFNGDADFRESVFSRHVNFLESVFTKRMDFRNAQFVTGVSFSDARLGAVGVMGPSSGPFYGTEFGGFANFRNARFTSLRFLRSVFRAGADFHGASGKRLQLHGVTVLGPLAFDDTGTIKELELKSFGGSMLVNGEAVFRRAQFEQLTFVGTAFKNTVDFQGAAVRSDITFETVSFDGDLHFEDAKLPGTMPKSAGESDDHRQPQINLNNITINKGLYIDAKQFLVSSPWWAPWREDTPRFVKEARDDSRVWRELMRAFELAKNVELKNYAEYKLRVSEERGEKLRDEPVERTTSVVSRWFWGYGLRPLRVLVWLTIVVLVFAGIYWTQLANMATGAAPGLGGVTRVRYAVVFSARTAWELAYGYNNSVSFAFRVITIAESIIAKLLLACFAYALTQTSPLLSELMKKLLP